LAATSDEESDQDHEAVTLEHPLRGPAVLVSLVAIAVIALAAGFLIEHESAKPTAEVSAADLGGSTAMKDLAAADYPPAGSNQPQRFSRASRY
jgi:hydrogenase/urease accessory protein HupE